MLRRKLDEILVVLPEDRRREAGRRVAELIAEVAKELNDFGAHPGSGANLLHRSL